MNPTYINASEFIETLQARGLVIVSAAEFELNNNLLRHRYMKRKSLSLSEIVSAKLLPLKSTKAISDWIEKGKIKPEETYREKTGQQKVMILTSAIRRLGYE